MEQVEKKAINKEVKLLIQEAIQTSPSKNRYAIYETLGTLVQEKYGDDTKKMRNEQDMLDKIDILMIDLMQKNQAKGTKKKDG